jgi:diguanylate cyclase (GGDEF)-like protein
MLRRLISPKNVTHHEARHLIEPAILATFGLGGFLILVSLQSILDGNMGNFSFFLGVLGVTYGLYLFFAVMPTPSRLQKWKWGATLSHSLLIGLAFIALPAELEIILQIIMILVAAIMVILWDRMSSYFFLGLTISFHVFFIYWFATDSYFTFFNHVSLALLAFVVVETIYRLSESSRNHMQRLESLNEFARKIAYSLETEELLSLVGAAVQNAIKADTYLLGVMENSETIKFDLIFDSGEYFPSARTPIDSTLSGWVIRNQRSLFIPDLQSDVDFEGTQAINIGKNETSLSWMGVPMRAGHVDGVISVGSYKVNSFDRTDLELLENLAQHAAIALENAYHHAEVKAQSHMDSLTSVYNHRYIVETMEREAGQSHLESAPLSLIMLDVDHFKQYNDTYGHLIGDQVLTLLTEAIRAHINASDSIGRWGGEEFAIVLPNTTGSQALMVAQRIRGTMSGMSIQGRDGTYLPIPTVSQGIAVFPQEVDNIHKLIDLADQRLYLAKERGRDQIEPDEGHWKRLK